MKKTGFIIGSVEIMLGLVCLIVANIINEIIPKIAKMCFMFNYGGFSETAYSLNLSTANSASICLCVLGILTITYFVFYKKEQ